MAQSALTVIFKLVIGGLTSIVFTVLGTVSLQFRDAFFPISLQSVLGIVAAQVLGGYRLAIMELASPPSVLVSIRQLTGYGSEHYL